MAWQTKYEIVLVSEGLITKSTNTFIVSHLLTGMKHYRSEVRGAFKF